jgi:feruloyl-CoA synthase
VSIRELADGGLLVSPLNPLGPYPRRLTERLEHWAAAAPDRMLIARRNPAAGGAWQGLTYGQMLGQVRAVGQALLDRGASAERPVAILSGNCLDQAVLTLAALHVGVPVAPVSPSYSLLAKDFAKLRHCLGLIRPGLVFADDGLRFADAIAAACPADAALIVTRPRAAKPRSSPRCAPRSPPMRWNARPPRWTRTRRQRSCSPRAPPACPRASSTPSG